ncbi:hypothetical protein [Frondihabitans sp. PAMC 28766]|uniref:hypothetical protein n=1 Tax=Frondihabitans sp. PAMC 28766 TaxID=1795630 RepID=UPI0012FFCE7E|nr:hypothetical protein [Frondihabitans sp. PAMC 28766]
MYDALTGPAERGVVEKLREESRSESIEPTEFSYNALIFGEIFGILVFGGMAAIIWSGHPSFAGLFGVVKALFFIITIGLGLFLLIVGLPVTIFHVRVQWAEYYRARTFASANGMTYVAAADAWNMDGAIFHMQGAKRRRSGGIFRSADWPGFEVVGHYHYRRENREVHWGYIAVDMRRALPHLVLRSKRRRLAHSRFMKRYAKSAEITLDVDKARRFTLYGDPDASSVARALFSNDLVTKLADLGPGIDAETIGTYLFVYSSRQFKVPRAKVVRSLFEVLHVALDYRKEPAPPPKLHT